MLLYVRLNRDDFKKLGEIILASVTAASRTSLPRLSSLRQTKLLRGTKLAIVFDQRQVEFELL